MSMGEKLVEKAWDSMERDLQEKHSSRRDFFYAVILAGVMCFGLAVAATWVSNRTGLSDAFKGGTMAAVQLPKMVDKLDRIDRNVAKLTGAVEALIGGRQAVMCATQDEARVANQ